MHHVMINNNMNNVDLVGVTQALKLKLKDSHTDTVMITHTHNDFE